MDIALLILGVLLLVAALWLCMRPHIPAVIAAYGGLWLLQWGDWLAFPTVMLSYWGVMAAMVIIISSMLPQPLVKATQGMVHITVASFACMLIGMTIGYAAMVIGAFVGAVAGGVVFARTPKGRGLDFPSSRFLQYMCAKGLPVVVAVSLVGIAIEVALVQYSY